MAKNHVKCTHKIIEAIFSELLGSSDSIKTICGRNSKYPTYRAVYYWMAKNEDSKSSYLKSKAIQTLFLFEELIDISDCVGKEHELLDKVAIERDKLKIQTRMRTAELLNRAIFGSTTDIKIAELTEKVEQITKLVNNRK